MYSDGDSAGNATSGDISLRPSGTEIHLLAANICSLVSFTVWGDKRQTFLLLNMNKGSLFE